MKQPLRIGDIIEVKAKDRRYSSTDYKIKITEITSCMAKGREIEKDGTLSLFGMNHRFNLNYDDKIISPISMGMMMSLIVGIER